MSTTSITKSSSSSSTTTTRSSLLSPYTLHNQAVDCILEGKYEDAVTLLQKAMKKVRLAISGDLRPGLFNTTNNHHHRRSLSLESEEEEEEGHHRSETTPHNNNSQYFCKFVHSSSGTSSSSSCFLKQQTSVSLSTTTTTTIFSSPIKLTNGYIDLFDPTSCEQFSYVAVYNLGLTYHLMATIQQQQQQTTRRSISKHSRRKLLQRALSLYENSHNVLMNSPDMDVSILHSLAIWSNLGHVLQSLNQKEKSILCYQHLLSTIFYVVDRELYGNKDRSNGSDDSNIPIDGFFSNVMNLLLKNESVAPAA